MRILIATAIFEPDGGGPATYAPRLARKLVESGCGVQVVAFSDTMRCAGDETYPFALLRIVRAGRIASRVRFLRTLLRAAKSADLIYSLDWYSVGFLVMLAARWRGIPYVVRVGGDYVWEQRYIDRTRHPVPLAEFYESGAFRSYPIPHWIICRVLVRASQVVFNTDWQRELYARYFGVRHSRVIHNPIPKEYMSAIKRIGSSHEFVFWGRFTAMKNIESLVRAFAQAELPKDYTLLLMGDGPKFEPVRALVAELGVSDRVQLLRETRFTVIMERVKNARAFVLPSWTDMSPNQVYEALAIGLPSLVTKETYLPIRDQLPLTIDPSSVEDIAAKLVLLSDERMYTSFTDAFQTISFEKTGDEVAREHIALFKDIVGESGFRVLSIGADRSKRGILFSDTAAFRRQQAYALQLGRLDIIGFSRASDGAQRYDDTHLTVVPTNSRSALGYGLDALRIARSVRKPSVVTVQDPFETGFVGWLIARRFDVPLHVQIHTDFLSPEYARLSPLNRIRIFVAGFVLARASRIRVVSERINRGIVSRYRLRAPITVLPIFADTVAFRSAIADSRHVARFSVFQKKALVVSRLEPEKNVALAIEAFARSSPKDACLIIVGDGSERSRLERHTYESGISDRVFFEGEQAGAAYYPLADIVLVPSHYEGYGLVIVEALAAGKPVLSTDVGVAREAGAIVTDEEGFADALADWFKRGPRAAELKNYPYANFDEHVRAYCENIRSAVL